MSDSHVVAALSEVMKELPAIGKDQRASQQQGGYAYRGIEQIAQHAAPLLAKHGVVFVPYVEAVEVREITVNNKPWTDTILTVRYRIYGPGGAADYIEACVVGIGRDNADKGANKALTQAFKYALIQTLCVADAKDDNDGRTDEADAPPPPAVATNADAEALKRRVDGLPATQRSAFVTWKNDQSFPVPWPLAAVHAMERKLDEIEAGELSGEAQDGTDPPDVEVNVSTSTPEGSEPDDRSGNGHGAAASPALELEEA